MKYIIFLACVAFTKASIFGYGGYGGYGVQREIRVDGDRRIFIRGSGKMVVINVPRDDPQSIEIVSKDANRMIKIIRINNDKEIVKQFSVVPGSGVDGVFVDQRGSEIRNRDEKSKEVDNPQMRVLINIFRKYEGVTGQAALYQLLKQVRQSIERQELNPIIYDVIRELEVKPKDEKTDMPALEDDSTENYLKGEAAKPQDIRDPKRNTEAQSNEDAEQKNKLTRALQAARQIQWVQNLLENKRNQSSGIIHEECSTRGADELLKSSINNSRFEGDVIALKQVLLQICIQEIQREIFQEQLRAQQLQFQEQFLNGQKQQLKSYKNVSTSKALPVRDAYDQTKKQEQQLIEQQLTIQRNVQKLQERLIRKQEQLREDLRKEEDRE